MTEKLKAKLKEAGLPDFIAGLFKVEKDEDIEDVMTAFEGITDAAKPEFETALNRLLTAQREAEADRRVNEAVKSHDKKLKEKFNLVKKDDVGRQNSGSNGSNGPGDNGEIAELRSAIQELQNTLKAEVERTTKEKVQSAFLEQAKEKNIPEQWAKKYQVDNLEKLDEMLVIAEKEYTDFRQQVITEQFGEAGVPRVGSGTLTDSTIVGYAKSKNKSDEAKTGIVGKQL